MQKQDSKNQPKTEKVLEVRPIDLTQAQPRRKHVNDPELVLPFDSYTAEGNALGTREIIAFASKYSVGSTQPDFLEISELTDGSGDIAAIPTLVQSEQTLDLKWGKGGKIPRIGFERFFAIRRFPIPDDTIAHIPIATQPVASQGQGQGQDQGPRQALVIRFSQATFQAIQHKKKATSNNNTKTDAANTKPEPADTPSSAKKQA